MPALADHETRPDGSPSGSGSSVRTRSILGFALAAVVVTGLIMAWAVGRDSSQSPADGPLVTTAEDGDRRTYEHESLPFRFDLPVDWEATDRSELLDDRNVAELYDVIVELRAPVPVGETDIVATLRRYTDSFTTFERVRDLCVECAIDDDRNVALPNGDKAEDYRTLVDIDRAHVTLWRHEGFIYALTTDERASVLGMPIAEVHELILLSIAHL